MQTQGFVQGISLSTFIQMVEMEKSTCTLKVQQGDESGLLHFVKGKMVDAELGEMQGQKAAYEIVNWSNAEIEIVSYPTLRPTRIDQSVTAILLDAARMMDESRRGGLKAVEELDEEEQEAVAEQAEEDEDEETAPEPPELIFTHSADEDPDMNKLHKVLETFREEVPEFVSTDIVNIESGLSIGGGSINPDFDASVASASYAEVVKSNHRALDLIGLGGDSTEDILVTTDQIYVLLRMLGSEYYHVLAVGRKGNLGLARAIMKKYEARLLSAVGELAG